MGYGSAATNSAPRLYPEIGGVPTLATAVVAPGEHES
ncbi:hypothetical protein C486_16520 [Natrinema gari JCM 14663]|uniref:Uncharacterized protein n=1 Tax=Natrinema gari JCM 14663 TaxID=1230459 RepID=L9YW14_9EURY|nr:hypothetical protein C486_16520 [Natrinema gari JCM 14663]